MGSPRSLVELVPHSLVVIKSLRTWKAGIEDKLVNTEVSDLFVGCDFRVEARLRFPGCRYRPPAPQYDGFRSGTNQGTDADFSRRS